MGIIRITVLNITCRPFCLLSTQSGVFSRSQCLEAVRDTLDGLAYYLLRRARSSPPLAHLNIPGGGTGEVKPMSPSGSVDTGCAIGNDAAETSSLAFDNASRELALRCARNIARSSRALAARFVHVSAARVERAYALFAAAARSGTAEKMRDCYNQNILRN